jgi:3-oxoadipate enol-lactonase
MQIQASGIVMNYELSGPEDGAVVMLSHSLGSNLYMWDLQVPALEQAGYRVLRYDIRGHGGTQVTVGPYSLAQLGDDAVALLDALGLEQVHFVGLSLGGMIGQVLALSHAERLAGLVLCDTMSVLPEGAQSVWAERIASARAQGMESLVEATLQRWFTADCLAEEPAPVKLIRQYFLATPVEGYIGCSEAITQLDYLDRLHTIALPTLVMVGAEDPGTPVATAEAIQQRIPGARLEIIPAASHLSNVEQPDEFNRRLLAFLNDRR